MNAFVIAPTQQYIIYFRIHLIIFRYLSFSEKRQYPKKSEYDEQNNGNNTEENSGDKCNDSSEAMEENP